MESKSSLQEGNKLANKNMKLLVIQEAKQVAININKGESSNDIIKKLMHKNSLNSNDKFLLKKVIEEEIIGTRNNG